MKIKLIISTLSILFIAGCTAQNNPTAKQDPILITGDAVKSELVDKICIPTRSMETLSYYYYKMDDKHFFDEHKITKNGERFHCLNNGYKTTLNIINPNNNRKQSVEVLSDKRYYRGEAIQIKYNK